MIHGLCHSDQTRAQECAQKCLIAHANSQHTNHSFVTRKWLEPDEMLRSYVEKVANGEPRSRFPETILTEIALLRFVNIAERHVEGMHKTVKLDAGHHSFGPVAVSAAVRLDPFLTAIERGDAIDIPQFLQCRHEPRQRHRLAKHLGVETHPDLMRAYGKETSARFLRYQMLRRLVYRCDYEIPFADTDPKE